MVSLAGLSATYPGYSAQEAATAKTNDTKANTDSTTIDNQIKARDAAIKMLGANVLGKAISGGQAGPQAPPPGQASVPNTPPAPPAAIPPPQAQQAPQGSPPPAPSQPAAAVQPASAA